MSHPLDCFLTEWEEIGGVVDIDTRERVYRAFTAGGRWSQARMVRTLGLLLTPPAQRATFEEFCHSFFVRIPEAATREDLDLKRAMQEIWDACQSSPFSPLPPELVPVVSTEPTHAKETAETGEVVIGSFGEGVEEVHTEPRTETREADQATTFAESGTQQEKGPPSLQRIWPWALLLLPLIFLSLPWTMSHGDVATKTQVNDGPSKPIDDRDDSDFRKTTSDNTHDSPENGQDTTTGDARRWVVPVCSAGILLVILGYMVRNVYYDRQQKKKEEESTKNFHTVVIKQQDIAPVEYTNPTPVEYTNPTPPKIATPKQEIEWKFRPWSYTDLRVGQFVFTDADLEGVWYIEPKRSDADGAPLGDEYLLCLGIPGWRPAVLETLLAGETLDATEQFTLVAILEPARLPAASALEDGTFLPRPKSLPHFDPSPADPDLSSPTPPQPLSRSELDRIAHLAGVRVQRAQVRLDITATVRATARSGGLIHPIFLPQRGPSQLWIRRPERADVVSSTLIQALHRGLSRRGLVVHTTTSSPPRSDEVDAALIFLDTSTEDLASLMAWRRFAPSYIETRDPSLWDVSVYRIHRPIHRPDATGIADALLRARGFARRETAPRIRPPMSIGDTLPLATACAVAQPCDIGTADMLRRRFTPRLPFTRLQKILRLRGVCPDPKGWTFSVELVDFLKERVGVPYLVELVKFQLQRLEQAMPEQPGTRSWHVVQRNAALCQLQLLGWEADFPDRPEQEKALSERLDEVMAVLAQQAGNPLLRGRLQEQLAELEPRWCVPTWATPWQRYRLFSLGLLKGEPPRPPLQVGEVAEHAGCPMYKVLPGNFLMGFLWGEPDQSPDDGPQWVKLTQSFQVSQSVVSIRFWRMVMGTVPHLRWPTPDEDQPMERLSWEDAAHFCNALSKMEGLPPSYLPSPNGFRRDYTARGYHIPTEAQWEYIARTGIHALFHDGTQVSTIGPPPVRSGQPTKWGLHVWCGVREWTDTWYAPRWRYEEQVDPIGPDQGNRKVVRGASWCEKGTNIATRYAVDPKINNDFIGFRIARPTD